jgi:hypothetical protein
VFTKAAFGLTQRHGLVAAALDAVRDAMLPDCDGFGHDPQRTVAEPGAGQVRAPATARLLEAEVCPLQPDNDDLSGL